MISFAFKVVLIVFVLGTLFYIARAGVIKGAYKLDANLAPQFHLREFRYFSPSPKTLDSRTASTSTAAVHNQTPVYSYAPSQNTVSHTAYSPSHVYYSPVVNSNPAANPTPATANQPTYYGSASADSGGPSQASN